MPRAVSIGFFPDNVLCRVARRTYGIQICTKFFTGVHPESLATYIEGVKHCRNVFSIIVQVGSTIEMDFLQEYFSPLKRNLTGVSIKVVSTQSRSPLYTTEPGVTVEGEFSVDISSSLHTAEDDRKFLVSMFFGHSSIEVKAQPSHLVGTSEAAHMLPVKYEWA